MRQSTQLGKSTRGSFRWTVKAFSPWNLGTTDEYSHWQGYPILVQGFLPKNTAGNIPKTSHDLEGLRYSTHYLWISYSNSYSLSKSLFLITLCFSHILSVLGLVPLHFNCLNRNTGRNFLKTNYNAWACHGPGACLKWVITTWEQASLFSIYLLLRPTEEFYTQYKIQFSCELKHFKKNPTKNI